ncbi:MAG: hypothetical protein IPP06_06500 [Saprospiraceae bacterium]|nr:hypothetical protein [Candidatus Vicinibacter affinis]
MERFSKLARFIFVGAFLSTVCMFSCNRGTGCPAEDANVKVDKHGNPKRKASSGLWDSKKRMNSSGSVKKSDKRKPIKKTN